MKKKLVPFILVAVLLIAMLLTTSCSQVSSIIDNIKDAVDDVIDNGDKTETTQYTVTFADWDGTTLKTETVESGKPAIAPADPAREGYTFAGWDKAFDNITSNTTVTATYTQIALDTYTVTFVDWDGTTLKTETVESGKSATAPADPTRADYTFTGWDKAFDNITSDTTVTATYRETITNPTFVVEKVVAAAGAQNVEVTVSLKKNPGVSSIGLSISCDNGITLTGFDYNGSIGGQSTPYSSAVASPKLVWINWIENVTGDWVFATLYFNVAENASGEYAISIAYNADDVYDVNETNIAFDIINGSITVN